MGNMSGSSGSHYTLWQSITQNSQDKANNKSNVTVRMYLTFDGSSWYAYTNYTTSGSMTINGTTHNYSIGSINFSSGQAKDLLLAEWTGNIDHDKTTGEKTLNVSGSWNTDTSKIGSGSCSTSLKLSTIPRYSEINSVSIQSMGLTTATIQYSVSRTANIYCSVDGGNWQGPMVYNTTSGTFHMGGLAPNVNHSFVVLVRAVDSGLDRISSTLFGNTLDIARISNLPNIEHGNDFIVGITNPANISNLNLAMSINDVQILNRSVNTGNNTIKMTDDELDKLYKKYGSGNSLTASFILSGSGYSEQKTCTVTLAGNQKTIYMNGKRGKVFVETKRGVTWQNVNGIWKRGG